LFWHFNPISRSGGQPDAGHAHRSCAILYRHMAEESGHEQWVGNDLEAIGVGEASR
jgi:hypothetical protein